MVTALEDGASRLDDARVLERATELGCVLFTHDADFLVLARDWQKQGRSFAGLVYAHQLEITVGEAIRDLELIARVLDPDEIRDRIEFIPY